MRITVSIAGTKSIERMLSKFDLDKNGRARGALRRTVRHALTKSWEEAVRSARIRIRTGRILQLKFSYPSKLTVRMETVHEHPKFFWYGTKRSRGRWIKYIRIYDPYSGSYTKEYLGKRFRKDKIAEYIAKYGEKFVGWHPGISTSKFPLRKEFRRISRQKLKDAVMRWFDRWYKDATR